jgi:hypothetical protein
VLAAVIFGGCAKSSTEQQILGAWQNDELSLTYQFDKDGKWSSKQVLPKLNHSSSGRWQLQGHAIVITPETSELIFDGKPKASPVGPAERDEIVTLTSSTLVLKMGGKDGQEKVGSFHRVSGK